MEEIIYFMNINTEISAPGLHTSVAVDDDFPWLVSTLVTDIFLGMYIAGYKFGKE